MEFATAIPTTPTHARPWLYFDEDFYLAQCIRFGVTPPLGATERLFQHYLDRGCRLGFSPNPFFDETYYLRRHPAVAQEVAARRWHCGFDHFIETGALTDCSPAWFFDGLYYKWMQPDLTDGNLQFGGFADRYAHYLLVGLSEARPGYWIVATLKEFADCFEFPTSTNALKRMLSGGETLAAVFKEVFDFDWMRERYDWGSTVRPNEYIGHYLAHVRQQKLSPSPYFDEAFYLDAEPEVRHAVEAGQFVSGYEHFITYGMREWRRPFKEFDPHHYYMANLKPHGQNTLVEQLPFVHFLRNRKRSHLEIAPPLSALDVPELIGKALYQRRCALNAPLLKELVFSSASKPTVSLIIVARDNYEQTANCITSAYFTTKSSFEVVVFDNGSDDDTKRLPALNGQIKYIRSATNIGFTVAVNRAAALATGQVIVLLNNDMELTPGAIDRAIEILDNSPDVGAVGAKILRMHGRLQEAGSIVWRDGTCLGYGRDSDPSDGQVNFGRDVDFCSGCFLAVRRSDWETLGGFDEAYAPAYYEETDLCLRIWQSGKRVIYDPRIVVWHFEFGTSPIREESLTLMRRNQRYFRGKFHDFLAQALPPGDRQVERARLRHLSGKKILFIEDLLPDPRRGMGFVRSAAVAEMLGKLGGLVSIMGLHDLQWPASHASDRGRNTELLTGVNINTVDRLFNDRVGVYDVVWLSRTHNLAHLRDWRNRHPEFFERVRVVLDTEAIASIRCHLYARHAGHSSELLACVKEEFQHLDGVDHICLVNAAEQRLLDGYLQSRSLTIDTSVLGHSSVPRYPFRKFPDTTDIVLVGSYSQVEGPNADALIWFDREVRPLIALPDKFRVLVAGSRAAAFLQHADLQHAYHVSDSPQEMNEVFSSARIMVAPTRFAAGIPFKVHDAASHGVPVVMTDLLAGQLGWLDEPGIVSTPINPSAMAEAIMDLAQNPSRWRECQRTQARLISRDCNPAEFERTIWQILNPNVNLACHEVNLSDRVTP